MRTFIQKPNGPQTTSGTFSRPSRKLAIHAPGDRAEQEADRVARQVMRSPAPRFEPASSVGGARASVQMEQPLREPASLQTKREQPSSAGQVAAPPLVHDVLRSPGQSLDAATRAAMEPRFGFDFSRVRVHSGTAAAQSAQAVNANAYTVGPNIVFGRGQFAPATQDGARLIAHELTHVVQQQAAMPLEARSPGASASRSAHTAATNALVLQREEKDPRQLEVQRTQERGRFRVSEWLVEKVPGGGTSRTELYWVDFEVDAKGVMKASVRTVSADRQYRSGLLRFNTEFTRAFEHFRKGGITVKAFEGDWSYMSKDEISDNLRVFKEGMAKGLTREKAAEATPTGRVLRTAGFRVSNVENVLESQDHLAEEGVRRWRVKATFTPDVVTPSPGGDPDKTGGKPAAKPDARQATTPDVRVKTKTTSPPAPYTPTVQGGGRLPELPRGGTTRRIAGRGVFVLAAMAVAWGVAQLKSAVTPDPDKNWDPELVVRHQLQARAGELLTLQVQNPYLPIWANVTFVAEHSDTYVVAGDHLVDESTYHGSSLESIELARFPLGGRWVDDYGSSRAGGGDRYVYTRQPVQLALAPFDQLVGHAKANKLSLDMLRLYVRHQLEEADKHRDHPQIPHMYRHWREIEQLINEP